jgi:hypothetical protein
VRRALEVHAGRGDAGALDATPRRAVGGRVKLAQAVADTGDAAVEGDVDVVEVVGGDLAAVGDGWPFLMPAPPGV